MFNKTFYKNIVFAGVTVFMLFLIWLKWLDVYTNHNHSFKAPNLAGVYIGSLDSLMGSYGLRYEIIDSVFDRSQQKGVIVNQEPLAGSYVKKNRKVYLTINSLKARKVNFPNVFDLTLRQAVQEIQQIGLEVGELEYRPDIATNKVLAFKVNGIIIDVGQELYYGTIVDLVLGQGLSDEKVIIPNLIGLSRIEANIIIKSTSLNIGLQYFHDGVLDSNYAIIYKQYPESDAIKEISIGSSIDLYFESPKE